MTIKNIIATIFSAIVLLVTPMVSGAVLLSSTTAAYAEELDGIDPSALLNMSLAELSNIEVTSVSKKEQKQTEAAAAIYTITNEDIRNSGATAIPELLRVVPGITVTRSANANWTVTARGFNSQFSNKLLVLMDGRTLYSPLFSGVIWDVQDTMLEDIDRIEVIRGPGATLWGANAVNGVINIITKDSAKTTGGLAVASAGNQVRGIASVRYGGKIGEDSHYRAYAKQTEYNSEFAATGGSANDDWGRSQFGFRTDSKITDSDTLNIQGDYYRNKEDANFTIPDLTAGPTYTSAANDIEAKGYNLMATWEHTASEESVATVQTYVDYTDYRTSFFNDTTLTLDIDAQHNYSAWDGHDIVWGLGYRMIRSENDPTAQFALTPTTRTDSLFNAFVQDEIALIDDELYLTLGSKFEHNDYTGVEIQPSARIAWLFDEGGKGLWGKEQTLWASVSRAVHTPSRYTSDAQLSFGVIPPGVLPTLIQYQGNNNVDSEELIAYELGYRINPSRFSSLDFAAFYNDYDKLFRDTLGTPFGPVFPGPYAVQPVSAQNTNAAKSYGLEIAAKWRPLENASWELAGSYSYIQTIFDNKDGGISSSFQGRHPKHQFNVRSTSNLTDELKMTNALYYVDELNGIGIDDYYRFDTRLAYTLTDDIELSLVGQNLLDSRHQEFAPFQFRGNTEIGRSVYGSVAFQF